MALRRAVLGGCGILGLIAAVGLGSSVRPPEAKDEAERLRSQQAVVETIADSLIARMDKEAELQHKLAIQERATLTNPVEVEQCRKTLEVVKIGLQEYLEGTYPTELATAKGNIALAESDLKMAMRWLRLNEDMSKNGVLVDNASAEFARDLAENAVKRAKNELEVLNKKEKPREIAYHEANIKAMEKEVRRFEDLVAQNPKALETLKRQVAEESLSELERRALRLLDEVVALQDKGDLNAAQAKLDEAETLWREEENRRASIHAANRFKTTKQRIHDAVKKLDAAAPKPE